MQKRVFRDFDAFAESVRGIDAVMMLQNPMQQRWVISDSNLLGMHLQLGRLASGNIVEGQSWTDGYVLYLPLTNSCEYSANGTVIDENAFMLLGPGSEFCVSTRFAHDWCALFVPVDALACGGNVVESSPRSGNILCRVTPPNPQIAYRFRSLVSQVMTTTGKNAHFESSPIASPVEAELLEIARLLVHKHPMNAPEKGGRPKVPRQEIIRRSKDLLAAREGESVLLEELATAADVSQRTLREAFQEYFGIGPTRYLQLVHLHRVYRALRAADPETTTVTDVLLQEGQCEFSRFAARYRRLFGELPSQTLSSCSTVRRSRRGVLEVA